MSYSDEKDIAVSIDDEKHTVRKSIASTSDSIDQSTLFSDDATIRADSTSPSHSRSQNAHRRKSSTSARFSSASAIPNAFALSRSCSPSGVVKSNHNSIMGAITGYAISRTGRFLRFLGLKSSCIRQRNVVRDWMRELDMLLNAPPEELLKSQGMLAQTLDDLLTITTTVPDVKGKSNEKDEQLLLSLMMRTIDSDWIKAITKYSYNTGQDGCIVVLVDYLCRLYRTQDADVILQKILHGILDCSTVHLAISTLLAPKFIRENVLPVLCEIASRRPEVFALEDVVGFHRDCLLLKLSSILYSCELTADFVTICGQDRLMLFIDAVSGDEYCTISKEFVVVSSFAAFAKYSPAVRQRLSDLASMSMFVSTLQISTLNVYGRAVSWDILLEVDGLSDKICEAAILLLRTLFNRNDQLWAKDDLFLGNLSRLIQNENFKKKFIEFGAVSSVLMSLEPLQGNHISLEAPSQPKRAVASLLMLLLRLDPDVMRRLTDGWFKGLDTQDGEITIGSFDLEVFCWATALFAVSVEFYPELAVYPERKDAIKRLVNGCRACDSPWGKEKYTLALELCWESVYGKPKLKELGLTEYDVMLGMHELKQC